MRRDRFPPPKKKTWIFVLREERKPRRSQLEREKEEGIKKFRMRTQKLGKRAFFPKKKSTRKARTSPPLFSEVSFLIPGGRWKIAVPRCCFFPCFYNRCFPNILGWELGILPFRDLQGWTSPPAFPLVMKNLEKRPMGDPSMRPIHGKSRFSLPHRSFGWRGPLDPFPAH